MHATDDLRKQQKARRQFGTSQRNDFIGMEFQAQTIFLGSLQQTAGLLDGENALFAEDITKLRPVRFWQRKARRH